MTITLSWQQAGAAAGTPPNKFVLAQSPSPLPMEGFSVNASRSIQEDKIIRSLNPLFQDRLNKHIEISFNVTRSGPGTGAAPFASQSAAEDYCLLHDEMFPGIFVVTFKTGSGSGPATTRTFPVMTVQSAQSRVRGLTVLHGYRLVGGASSAATI